jgi:uncharacterized protein YciI
MPLYAIIAKDKPNGFEHRQAVRPEHLKHLDSLGDKLAFAGPLQDEAGKSNGSIVVIDADDLDTAKRLFGEDPFIQQGVFASWEISRFALTINKSAGR